MVLFHEFDDFLVVVEYSDPAAPRSPAWLHNPEITVPI